MNNWRIEFAMATTDATVDSFECEIDELSRYISKTGTLSGQIPIVNPATGIRAAKILGGEGKLTMYAYLGEVCWWGGFLDRTTLTSNDYGAKLDFSGSTFEAYPDRREARSDQTFKGKEQTEYARWCWDYMLGSGAGSTLRINTAFPPVKSRSLDMEWKRSDIRTIGSILKEASNRVDGFEWMIDCYNSQGTRHRDLLVGYPTIGRPNYELTLTYPGNILEYEIEGDALDGATSFQARGKAPDPVGTPNDSRGVYDPKTGKTEIIGNAPKGSEKQDPIMSKVYDATDMLKAGMLRTDATVEQDKVTDVNVLNAWAELARDLRSGPLVLPSILARMQGISQSVLGSNVKLRINDHPFPMGPYGEPGYEHSARCIGYEIDPGEFGSPDTARIIFENPYDDDAMNRIPL